MHFFAFSAKIRWYQHSLVSVEGPNNLLPERLIQGADFDLFREFRSGWRPQKVFASFATMVTNAVIDCSYYVGLSGASLDTSPTMGYECTSWIATINQDALDIQLRNTNTLLPMAIMNPLMLNIKLSGHLCLQASLHFTSSKT